MNMRIGLGKIGEIPNFSGGPVIFRLETIDPRSNYNDHEVL